MNRRTLPTSCRVGRPQSPAVSSAILAAARRLVIRIGYEAVTVQMIAAEAGAGKQAIYRRWPGKAELVLDAFLAEARGHIDRASTGSVERDLVDFFRRTAVALNENGRAIRSLMAQAQGDPAFLRLYFQRFIQPRRDALRALLDSAQKRGELPTEADTATAVALLYGAMWYRLLLDEPFEQRFIRRMVSTLLGGLRGPQVASKASPRLPAAKRQFRRL